jgi:hypothetical protein
VAANVDRDMQLQLSAKSDVREGMNDLSKRYDMLTKQLGSDKAAYDVLRDQLLGDYELELKGVDLSHASEEAKVARDMLLSGVQAERANTKMKAAQTLQIQREQNETSKAVARIHEGGATHRTKLELADREKERAKDLIISEMTKASQGPKPIGFKVPGAGVIKDPGVWEQATPEMKNEFVKKNSARAEVISLIDKYAAVAQNRSRVKALGGSWTSDDQMLLDSLKTEIGTAQSRAKGMGAWDNGTQAAAEKILGDSYWTDRNANLLQDIKTRQAASATLDASMLGLQIDPEAAPYFRSGMAAGKGWEPSGR